MVWYRFLIHPNNPDFLFLIKENLALKHARFHVNSAELNHEVQLKHTHLSKINLFYTHQTRSSLKLDRSQHKTIIQLLTDILNK